MAKEIPLSQGKVAIIDDEDFDRVNQYKWHAKCYRGRFWYAARNIWDASTKKQKTQMLHTFITGLSYVDHRDRNGLNNQKENLRFATPSLNCVNRLCISASGYRGIKRYRSTDRWLAQISWRRKKIFIGHYDTPQLAARAYDKVASVLHGEFAILNFPEECTNV